MYNIQKRVVVMVDVIGIEKTREHCATHTCRLLWKGIVVVVVVDVEIENDKKDGILCEKLWKKERETEDR